MFKLFGLVFEKRKDKINQEVKPEVAEKAPDAPQVVGQAEPETEAINQVASKVKQEIETTSQKSEAAGIEARHETAIMVVNEPLEAVKLSDQLKAPLEEAKSSDQPKESIESVTPSDRTEEPAAVESPVPAKGPEKKQSGSPSLVYDDQTSFTGEVELLMEVPVDLKLVSKLYDNLQTVPELRILHIRGSINQGTIITVGLGKPMPLISIIASKLPGAEITPELPQKSGSGKASFLGGKKKMPLRRLKIASKRV